MHSDRQASHWWAICSKKNRKPVACPSALSLWLQFPKACRDTLLASASFPGSGRSRKNNWSRQRLPGLLCCPNHTLQTPLVDPTLSFTLCPFHRWGNQRSERPQVIQSGCNLAETWIQKNLWNWAGYQWFILVILATWEDEIQKFEVWGQPGQIVLKIPIFKITRAKWTGGVAQVVEPKKQNKTKNF
jgi:hypothetical protein